MTRGERAVIFGRSADTYDEARPAYPVEAIDHVLGLTSVETAVEIGAGTGKATSGFARSGLVITCVEPDPDMTRVLRARSLPGVDVVESSFETWAGPERPVDLVYAAQAWHWVDHDTAYERARGMLRDGGALALMWNIPKSRYDRFDDVYGELAPEILTEHDRRIRRRDSGRWLDELGASSFRDTGAFSHEWSAVLTGAEVRRLYSTYSDHMMIPEPRRGRLLAALEQATEEMGGSVVLEYETRVFSGIA